MTTTGAASPPPPPPPPPPASAPGAPPWAGLPGQASSLIALAKGAWAEAMARLDREAGRVGLGTEARSGSVWPVIGFGFLVVALIADRVHSVHDVPVRWLVTLLLFGLVVVAGQLRAGGRLPALAALPAVFGSPVLLTCLALLLAAQQADFLSLGVTQVAWFLALVCVVVPLVRDARRPGPPPPPPPTAPHSPAQSLTVQSLATQSMTALRQSAPLVGAALVVVAVVIGWLPNQYGPEWFWTVVLLAAAGVAGAAEIAKLPAHRFSLPAPVAEVALWVLTALVAGVAVVSARLQVTSVLWLAAAYVLVREAWRRLAAEGGPVPLRSRAGIALAAIGIAVLSLFGTTNSVSSGGYFIGGYTYDPYSYDADSSGFAYNMTEYYEPGLYFEDSGRAEPFAIVFVAGLAAMAGVVRRRRMTNQLRIGAGVVAGGAAIWSLAEGSLSYLAVWVFVGAVAVAAVATVTDRTSSG